MAISVMIVDDEKDIREYLKQIIDWDSKDLSLVCEAEDSISAKELFSLHRPQIVFLDVCIPDFEGHTGLDLAREFCKIDRDTRIIIITGYADFDYAQQALAAGAIDLQLKPLQADRIAQSLDKALLYYQEKRHRLLSQSAIQNLISENLNILRKKKISSILTNSDVIIDGCIDEQLKLLSIDIINDNYTAVYVRVDDSITDNKNTNPQTDLLAITQMCEQVLLENGFKVCADFPEGNIVRFVVSWPSDNSNENLEVLLNKFACDIFQCLHLNIRVSIGNTITNLKYISTSAECAMKCLSCADFSTGEIVFNYKNYRDSLHMDVTSSVNMEPLALIERDLKLLRHKEVVSHINDWFKDDVANDTLQNFCVAYLSLITKLAQTHNIRLWNSEDLFLLIQHVNSSSKKQVKNAIITDTENLFYRIDKRMRDRSLQENDIVAMAKKYVQDNLTQQSLCFDDVCNHIGITKNYFGRLFQKEEGISFIYINKCRIELAKNILVQTNLRTYEVAEKSGFSNSNYFCVIFKSITGMTPLDYRRSTRFD